MRIERGAWKQFIDLCRSRIVQLIICQFFLTTALTAQMRQIHVEPLLSGNTIKEFSFYSPSHGYIAGDDNGPWVGFTSDSGRTYVKRYITDSNVDTGPYTVSLPFLIEGVKAFSKDTIVVYGGFNVTPSVLYSTDGGQTYLLTYHFQGPGQFGFIYDMAFARNSSVGYATDGFRIIKTGNKGQSWTTTFTDNNGFLSQLDAIDNDNVFAFPDFLNGSSNKMYKTSNGGGSWQQVTVPGSRIYSADFISPSKGWINIEVNDSVMLYHTTNSGASWVRKNDGDAFSMGFYKMRFVNDSTGYGLAMNGAYDTYKTTDTARSWEPLIRNNNFSYLAYGHYEIQAWNEQQVWCGGEKEFIELTTNGGGTPLPKAYFTIDITGIGGTGIVKLINYSKRNYTYKWIVNNVLVSTDYNTTFNHVAGNTYDSIKLIVSNGAISDTSIHVQYYASSVSITSVNPQNAITGTVVTIKGTSFTGATSVTFGGTPAASFTVNSNTSITATVGSGSSGFVRVNTPMGQGIYTGFTYTPPPIITSFSPASAATGATVIISGANFTGATAVQFGIYFAASFKVVNSTMITAEVSNSAGGTISVTTPGGVGTLGGFTHIPFPYPTTVSPNIGGTGTVVTITGTNFNGATAVKFGDVNAASFTLNSPTSITAIVGAGGSGKVWVTTPGGTYDGPVFTYTTKPIINFLSPSNGPVGTTVTLTGANFPTNPFSNIVYFGPVKANVVSSTANTLTVVVPLAASSGQINVNCNGIQITSPHQFIVTFPGDLVLNSSSFAGKMDFASGNYPRDVAVADFDGDGKPDMVAANNMSNTLSFFRNTSSPNNISFAPKIDSSSGVNRPVKIAVGDLDGDGKLDLVCTCQNPSGIGTSFGNTIIYRNTSTPGVISFAQRLEIAVGIDPTSIMVRDFNGDGKPDVVVLNGGIPGYVMCENTTSGSAISFLIRNAISLSQVPGDYNFPSSMAAGDFGFVFGKGTMLAFGYMNFYGGPESGAYADVVSEDLDNDGKSDIITNKYVLRNTTVMGYRDFEQSSHTDRAVYSKGGISNLNGDAKADYLKSNFLSSTVSVLRNASSPGSISLITDAQFATGLSPEGITTADFDLDQRPDILVANTGADNISILKNQVNINGPMIYSFTPTTGITGSVVTITGINFTGATAVTFNGIAASSFTVVNATTITAVVGSGGTGVVSVTTPAGTASLGGFSFGSAPTITSFVPTSAGTGTTVTISGSNFTGATAVSFGGVAAASFTVNSSASITATVGLGASGNVSVTTPGGTAMLDGFTFISAPAIASFTPTSAASGATVTITGTNLTGATAVSFGGLTATSFTVNSSTNITAIVGAGASGNVSVTTPGGIATLSGFIFIAQPTITSFTPTNGGAGTSITITGSNFTSATDVSIGGIPVASFIVNSSTSISVMVGTGASGNVSVTTAGGTATLVGFTFMSPPTITTFTPEKGRSGITVTISGTNFNETTSVSFGGVPAASFIINSSTSISAVVGAGASGDITVTTPYGTATTGGFAFEAGRGVNELVIYPNPADEFVLVKHPSTDLPAQLKVIDLTGKVVKVIIPERNASETRIDLKGLLQGIYEVVWSDGKNKASQKLMLYK